MVMASKAKFPSLSPNIGAQFTIAHAVVDLRQRKDLPLTHNLWNSQPQDMGSGPGLGWEGGFKKRSSSDS